MSNVSHSKTPNTIHFYYYLFIVIDIINDLRLTLSSQPSLPPSTYCQRILFFYLSIYLLFIYYLFINYIIFIEYKNLHAHTDYTHEIKKEMRWLDISIYAYILVLVHILYSEKESLSKSLS